MEIVPLGTGPGSNPCPKILTEKDCAAMMSGYVRVRRRTELCAQLKSPRSITRNGDKCANPTQRQRSVSRERFITPRGGRKSLHVHPENTGRRRVSRETKQLEPNVTIRVRLTADFPNHS